MKSKQAVCCFFVQGLPKRAADVQPIDAFGRGKLRPFALIVHNVKGVLSVRALAPADIGPPLARYSHGIAVPPGYRLVVTSGQLGLDADGGIPPDCEGQAERCFANIAAILGEAGMTLANVVRLNAYVSDRRHLSGYMQCRDRHFPSTPPASTLMIVSGFSRPEFVVEIEAIAAAPELGPGQIQEKE